MSRGACVCKDKTPPENVEGKCRKYERTLKFGDINIAEYKKGIEICRAEAKITEQVFQEEMIGPITVHGPINTEFGKMVDDFYQQPLFYSRETKCYNLQHLELLGPLICKGTKEEKVQYYYIIYNDFRAYI